MRLLHPINKFQRFFRPGNFLLVLFLMLSFLASGQTTGLVLSGGGARGMAHIGVLKALEENNIPINYITGTSAGAIIGAMYAIGLSPAEIEQLVLSGEFKDWATGNIHEELDYYYNKQDPTASWISLKFSIDSVLHTHLPINVVSSARSDFALMENLSAAIAKAQYNFDSLFIPFRCVAADIKSRKQVIFKEGDLALAVRASMAYPLYFSPVSIDDKIMFDGGIYNNFPVDVMLSEFNPDIIIGVNAGSYTDIPYEENLWSMFRTMIVQSTNYSVPREQDFLINPAVTDISVFDFDETRAAIDSGYHATMRQIEAIRQQLEPVVTPESRLKYRQEFRSQFKPIIIDQIRATGINRYQEAYVQRILNYHNECISVEDLRPLYFKLITNAQIKSVFPRLIFNEQTGYYDLDLLVKKEQDLRIDFGGNISSSPINQAFVGFQYNYWRKQAMTMNANIYFGKLYNSAHVSLRMDIKKRYQFYVEPVVTLNRFDYFKSSSAFLEDVKPAYLIQNDEFYGGNVGIPARNKGKLVAGAGYVNLINRYYQTRDFSSNDLADKTEFEGFSGALMFERNTLNKKMYASRGTFFSINGRIVVGKEKTTPGTTGLFTDTISEGQEWLQLHVTYDNYFKNMGRFTFGFYSELFFSSQPFFANYTATILSARGYQPLAQSKTLFLDNYRAHNFIGTGLKSIFRITNNFEARLEGHLFQPLQAIIETGSRKSKYGDPFADRSFLANVSTVYHTPVGPVSVSLNYYEKRDNPFSVMFHFGYILFNRRALD
jgi:NTE family protein